MAQEIPRGKFAFQFRRPVEVARLVGAPFRFRPLEGGRSKEPGAGHFPKMLNRPFQVGPRVSQVRSKSDVSECHSQNRVSSASSFVEVFSGEPLRKTRDFPAFSRDFPAFPADFPALSVDIPMFSEEFPP